MEQKTRNDPEQFDDGAMLNVEQQVDQDHGHGEQVQVNDNLDNQPPLVVADVYDQSQQLIDIVPQSQNDASEVVTPDQAVDEDENVVHSDQRHNEPTDIFENSMPVNVVDKQAAAENLNKSEHDSQEQLVIEDKLNLSAEGFKADDNEPNADSSVKQGRNDTLIQAYSKSSPPSKQHPQSMDPESPEGDDGLDGRHTFGLIPMAAVSDSDVQRREKRVEEGQLTYEDDRSNHRSKSDTQVIEFLVSAGDEMTKTDDGDFDQRNAQPEVVASKAVVSHRSGRQGPVQRSRRNGSGTSGFESQFHALLAARNIQIDDMVRDRSQEPNEDSTSKQEFQTSLTRDNHQAADVLHEKLLQMQASYDEEQQRQEAMESSDQAAASNMPRLAAQLTFSNNVFDIAINRQPAPETDDRADEPVEQNINTQELLHTAITEVTQDLDQTSGGTAADRLNRAQTDQDALGTSATRSRALGDVFGGSSQTRAKSSQLSHSSYQQRKLKALGQQRALQRSTREPSGRKETHNFATSAYKNINGDLPGPHVNNRSQRPEHLAAIKTINSSRSLRQIPPQSSDIQRSQSRGHNARGAKVECASAMVRTAAVTNMKSSTSVTSSQKVFNKLQHPALTINADSVTNMSVGEGEASEAQQALAAPPITDEEIKNEMVEAFKKIRLDTYSDILRIKKPQMQAFVASQLLCRLVNSFRGGAQKHDGFDSKFQEWQNIQDFVHKRPNVIKFNQEITQLIQHMILSKDYLKQIRSDQLRNHLSKIQKIQQQFFGMKSKSQIIRQFQTTKNFAAIVLLCFCIVRYVLYQAGRTHLLNLQSEQAVPTPTSRAASRSNRSGSNRRGGLAPPGGDSDFDNDSCSRSRVSSTKGSRAAAKLFTVGRPRTGAGGDSFLARGISNSSATAKQSSSVTRAGAGFASRSGKLRTQQQRGSVLSQSHNDQKTSSNKKKTHSRQTVENFGKSVGRHYDKASLRFDVDSVGYDRNTIVSNVVNRLSTPKQGAIGHGRTSYAIGSEPQNRLNESAQNMRRVPFISKQAAALSQSAMVGAARNQENVSETDSVTLQKRKQSKAILVTKAAQKTPAGGYFDRQKSSVARTRVQHFQPHSAKERQPVVKKKKTEQLTTKQVGTTDNFFKKSKKDDTPTDIYQPKSPQKENRNRSPARKQRSPPRGARQGSPLEVQNIAQESAVNDLSQKLDLIKAAETRTRQHQKIVKAQQQPIKSYNVSAGLQSKYQVPQQANRKTVTQNKKQIAMIHKERQDLEQRYERLTLSAISGNSNPSAYRTRKAPGLTLQQLPQVSGGAHGAMAPNQDCFVLEQRSTPFSKVEESARFSSEVDDSRRVVVPGKESAIESAANAVKLNLKSEKNSTDLIGEGIFEKSGTQDGAYLMPSVIQQSKPVDETTPAVVGKDLYSDRSGSVEAGSATIKRQRKSRQERSQERKMRGLGQKRQIRVVNAGEYQEQPVVRLSDEHKPAATIQSDLDEFLQLENLVQGEVLDSAAYLDSQEQVTDRQQQSSQDFVPHSASQISVTNQIQEVAPVPMERPADPLYDFQSDQHKSVSVEPALAEPSAFQVPGFESRSESDGTDTKIQHVSEHEFGANKEDDEGQSTDHDAVKPADQSEMNGSTIHEEQQKQQDDMNEMDAQEAEFEARVTRAQEEARAIASLLKAEASATSSGDPTEGPARDGQNTELQSHSKVSEELQDEMTMHESGTGNQLINIELPRLPLETTGYEAAEAISSSLIQMSTEPSGRIRTHRQDMQSTSANAQVLDMMVPNGQANLTNDVANQLYRPSTVAIDETHHQSVQSGLHSSKKKRKAADNVVRRLYPRSPTNQVKSPTKSSSITNSASATSKGAAGRKSLQGTASKNGQSGKKTITSVFSKTKSPQSKSGRKNVNTGASNDVKAPDVNSFSTHMPDQSQLHSATTYQHVLNQSVDGAHLHYEQLDLPLPRVNNLFGTVEHSSEHHDVHSTSMAESQRTQVLPQDDKVIQQVGETKYVPFVASPSPTTKQSLMSPEQQHVTVLEHAQPESDGPTTPKAEERKSENVEDSRSSGSEDQMQEIMSPFKQLRIMKDPSAAIDDERRSPPPQAVELETAGVEGWKINPIKVSRGSPKVNRFDDDQMEQEFSSINARSMISLQTFQAQLNNYSNQYVKRKEPPRQSAADEGVSSLAMMHQISEPAISRRSDMFEQLLTSQQQMVANSPTRHSFVNPDVIQQLKERRMQQREDLFQMQQQQEQNENLEESDDE